MRKNGVRIIDNTSVYGNENGKQLKEKVLSSLLKKVSEEKHNLFLESKSYAAEGIDDDTKDLKNRILFLEKNENNLNRYKQNRKKTIKYVEVKDSHVRKDFVSSELENTETLIDENDFLSKGEPVDVQTVKVLSENELKAKELLKEWEIDSRTSFKDEYQKRLYDLDFFSAFKLLTVRMNAIPDIEDKQELEDFFSTHKDILRISAEKDLLASYATYLADFITNANLTENNKETLVYLFPIGAMSLCFSVLVSAGSLNTATVLKPYINNSLVAYPNVLRDLINQNKISALDYLLENTINLNFKNNTLMNLLMGLSSYEKIFYFFNKYDLDINARLSNDSSNHVSAPEWNTLFAHIVESKNFALFKEVLESKQKPDFSVLIRRDTADKLRNYSVFYFIRNDSDFYRYVDAALDYNGISNLEINAILSLLMQNPQSLMSNINNGVMDKIFNHPELKSVSFIEGTVHLFGFLSCADYWSKSNMSELVLDSFKYILDKFLMRFPDTKIIPIGSSVNLYGSTVYLLAKNEDTRLFNLLLPILRHYREWINVENPCGKVPVELIPADNKRLKATLISLGAVERKFNFKWKFWEKHPKHNIDFSQRESLQDEGYSSANNAISNDISSFTGTGEAVEAEMRESFNQIRPSLKKMPLDVRLACEDLFLNAENLLMVTSEKERDKFNEDMFFLVQTFNDYLPSIISSYQNSMELSFMSNPSESSMNNGDKDEVLKQIDMLNNHVKKLKANFELKLKKNIDMDIQKNTEFLKAKLGNFESEGSKRIKTLDEHIQKSQDD